MSVHPQCKAFLDILASAGGPPLEQLSAAEARQATGGMAAFGGPEEPVARVEDRVVPGPGGSIPVRVYRPTASTDRLPALVSCHGGGWVLGNLDSHDRVCRSLSRASGCVVISVDYRLAPENRFPAAAEDAFAVTSHVATHPDEFGIDPDRIAVGGDSAGGNLAAAVTLMARDRGGPRLRFQLLVYPLVDADDQSPSIREFGQNHFITREMMEWFNNQYFATAADRRSPYASPLKADLSGLPPAMIMTAECDPLRDQGEAYARKLERSGVPVTLKRYEGMVHPFLSLAGIVDTARVALADASKALAQALQGRAVAGV
jgi:acetyl esterase